MICPRCRIPMVQNAYGDKGQHLCNVCDLVITLNDDGEIVSTNEDVKLAYILRAATGGAARRIYERSVPSHAEKLVNPAEDKRGVPTQRP